MEDTKKKKLPECNTEEEERTFWATADSTKYVDWTSAKRSKPLHLMPSLKTISLRLQFAMTTCRKSRAR
jgi:hypothetical protein